MCSYSKICMNYGFITSKPLLMKIVDFIFNKKQESQLFSGVIDANIVFISFYFYLFIAALLLAYYIIPLRFRWFALLTGSMIFYWYLSQGSKRRFFMLIALSFVSWIYSLLMEHDGKHKRMYLLLSVIMVALPLLVIKEYPFVLSSFLHKDMPNWWLVPVGIAFFSLQLISYNVDVYKGTIKAERNYFKYLLFASFFPQIIQGPIPRYSQLSKQLYAGNRFDERKFVKGFMLILWGFFLKLCIADKAGIIVNKVFDNYPTYRGMYILVAGILYSIQLYADFMSCTSLAQGIANLFGIDIIDNFMHPYFAISIKDFWRRWHTSLSSWLRDYIYIPLGGNRKGKFRKYVNILVTFAVSGIWHGAGYKYLFWGLLHGVYQLFGEWLEPIKEKICDVFKLRKNNVGYRIYKRVVTFILVMLAWIIFRADHLRTGLSMIKSIITVHNPWILTNDALYSLGLGWKEFHVLLLCLLVLLLVSAVQERGIVVRDYILGRNIVLRWLIYIGAILFIMVFGTYGYGFDAQAFIYRGF